MSSVPAVAAECEAPARPADGRQPAGSEPSRLTWRLVLAIELTVLLVVGAADLSVESALGAVFGVCFVIAAWFAAAGAPRSDSVLAATAGPAVMLVAMATLAVVTGHDLAAGYSGWRMVPMALGHQLWALIIGTTGAMVCAAARHRGRPRVASAR